MKTLILVQWLQGPHKNEYALIVKNFRIYIFAKHVFNFTTVFKASKWIGPDKCSQKKKNFQHSNEIHGTQQCDVQVKKALYQFKFNWNTNHCNTDTRATLSQEWRSQRSTFKHKTNLMPRPWKDTLKQVSVSAMHSKWWRQGENRLPCEPKTWKWRQNQCDDTASWELIAVLQYCFRQQCRREIGHLNTVLASKPHMKCSETTKLLLW